ncbi:dnaJ homolog subfamily C member 2 [Cimex lectularius]|uniref:DnaJ homolog subfamily C member 2 n=1 Tax=Cimex lectularius TaxID=79782 RepID=A0A8I6RNW1_CIMLE|nr:dnaJ homolog subfamily C member 2 [Cimex lectularius]
MVEARGLCDGATYRYWNVECVGPYYVQYLALLHDDSDGLSDDSSNASEQSEEAFVVDPDDDAYLRSLDPKEWKKQDHYEVLGLKSLRFKASPNVIKSAYRQKVLKHHPDKRKAKGEVVKRDEDYFTCITKAWEILGDKTKRRAYDSVDPYFDDALPSNSEIAKKDFYKLFKAYFDRNSRWSEKTPVPELGDADASREAVNRFYSFWYDFDSWREYSYEDEEAKESGQDREERRWIEKQNKAVRSKKKKEELARIRNLVDLAYNADPRIVKFKNEDKLKKEAAKKAKQDAARARVEEAERAQREAEEAKLKEKEEAAEKEALRLKAIKAEKEAQKRALKKARKTLRDLCKENGYYVTNENDLVKYMEFSEKLCEMMSALELDDFSNKLKEGGNEVYRAKFEEVEQRVIKEHQQMMSGIGNKQMNGQVNNKSHNWSQADITLLIKAVNLFPAGTSQRWDVVANFINQHSKNKQKDVSAREVLSKAKELQTNDDSKSMLKQAANNKAYDNFEKQKKMPTSVEAETSQRFDLQPETNAAPWTAEEQSLLEQALKTYPSSTEERWDKIADCIPTRSKKDCMKRYKDLVQMIKAKKEAVKSVKK